MEEIMNFMTIKDFITEDERIYLRDFYLNEIKNESTMIINEFGNISYHCDNSKEQVALYSVLEKNDIVHEIDKRIIDYFGLHNYKRKGKKGTDGSWAMIMLNGSELKAHYDPNSEISKEEEIIRCNILIQKPKYGGILYESSIHNAEKTYL